MAKSKGQAPMMHGHSPGGSFGHGGHHKKDMIHSPVASSDHMRSPITPDMEQTGTAGTV